MVERLKQAIEKARQQRQGGERVDVPASVPSRALDDRDAAWQALPEITFDPAVLTRHRLQHPDQGGFGGIQMPFDILRTRLRKACLENNWYRVGVTSPTKGCGKSFVTANLAFSFGRNPGLHTIVVDFDLKNPQLARAFGVTPPHPLRSLLDGMSTPDKVLMRHGSNLAFALQDSPIRYSAELIQAAGTASAITALARTYAPDLILFDLPPLFIADDVLGFLGQLDAIILVAAAGKTTASDIAEAEDLFANGTNYLGVVLNKVDGVSMKDYYSTYAGSDVSA